MDDRTDAITALLERLFPVWDKLSSDERAQLAAGTRPQSFPAGAHIHNGKNDCVGIFVVVRGSLRVYFLSEEGREITLFRAGPGEICLLSAPCAISLVTFDVFIDAQTDVDLLVISTTAFRNAMEGNPYVEAFAYRQISTRFSEVMWVMQQVLFVSFDKRLAAYLLAEARAQKTSSISITHDRIARDLGNAREVVSRMLKYFEKEGLVKLGRGTVGIVDAKGLEEIAG